MEDLAVRADKKRRMPRRASAPECILYPLFLSTSITPIQGGGPCLRHLSTYWGASRSQSA